MSLGVTERVKIEYFLNNKADKLNILMSNVSIQSNEAPPSKPNIFNSLLFSVVLYNFLNVYSQ
jgi:hypothetical protein